jgi:hypothetical protein
MPRKVGYVDRSKWLANADDAKQDIETNGYLTFNSIWKKRTFDDRANLEPWQEEKLVKIYFPLTKEENKGRKMALKWAKVERNIAVMTDEVAKKGIHLAPNQIKHTCGAYNVERKLCRFEGGCTNIAKRGGLCNSHQGAVATAFAPQANNLLQPMEVVQAENSCRDTLSTLVAASLPANNDDGLVLSRCEVIVEDAVFDMDAVLEDDILIDALSTLMETLSTLMEEDVFDKDVVFNERFHVPFHSI